MHRVSRVVKNQGLIRKGDRLLVALSGGADSVALLHVLHVLYGKSHFLAAAHLNHGIRGSEAAEDAAFCQELCASLEIPFFSQQVNVPLRARRRGLSLEMAAREARQSFLESTARRNGCTGICLGHHADDQAETVLLKLARGSGLEGLGGMKPVQQMHGHRYIRPLLPLRRACLEDYLARHKAAWRTDATNLEDGPLRNRVRSKLIPLMEEILNPRITETLCRTSKLLRDDEDWLQQEAEGVLSEISGSDGRLMADLFSALPSFMHRRLARDWLVQSGVPGLQVTTALVDSLVRFILKGGSGEIPGLPAGRQVAWEGRTIMVAAESEISPEFRIRISCQAETAVPGCELTAQVRKALGPGAMARGRIGRYPTSARISAAKVGRSVLYLRTWQEGDRFMPLGMKGSIKLHDLFINRKVPRRLRGQVPLLECRGRIVWVPGYTIDRDFRVNGPLERSLEITLA